MSQSIKLEAMKQRIAQQQARLRDEKARLRKLSREADTRRKILYGIAILALLEDLKNEQRERLLHRLNEKITRDTDRDFLGLRGPASESSRSSSAQSM